MLYSLIRSKEITSINNVNIFFYIIFAIIRDIAIILSVMVHGERSGHFTTYEFKMFWSRKHCKSFIFCFYRIIINISIRIQIPIIIRCKLLMKVIQINCRFLSKILICTKKYFFFDKIQRYNKTFQQFFHLLLILTVFLAMDNIYLKTKSFSSISIRVFHHPLPTIF